MRYRKLCIVACTLAVGVAFVAQVPRLSGQPDDQDAKVLKALHQAEKAQDAQTPTKPKKKSKKEKKADMAAPAVTPAPAPAVVTTPASPDEDAKLLEALHQAE